MLRAFDLVGSNLDRSDHALFWNAGVPCVVVTDTAPMRNPRYHHDTDTADTLDYSRLAAVCSATTQLALGWLAGKIPIGEEGS